MSDPRTAEHFDWQTGITVQHNFGPSEGKLRDFIRLLHASDGLTQCQTAATLAITLWQVAGRAFSWDLPSMLLINANAAVDPLDALARASTGNRPKDPVDNEGHYENDGEHSNRDLMRQLAKNGDIWAQQSPSQHAAWLKQCGPLWVKAQHNSFGFGRAGQYSRRWDNELGVVTDVDGSLILRVERDVDHALLRDDILHHPERILRPLGRNKNMAVVCKAVAISGSLNPAQWDAEIVASVLEEGLPILFLPHTAQAPLKGINSNWGLAVWQFENLFRASDPGTHVLVTPLGKQDDWTCALEERLRDRLRFMPGAYNFFVLCVLRELQVACLGIARGFETPDASIHEVACLAQDLYRLAATGIAIGVESLAWHGQGFDPGCPTATAQAILKHLRAAGTQSRRDLQRHLQKLTAAQLAVVLETLAGEGLVALDERTVCAVTFTDYIETLSLRSGYQVPELLTKELIREWNK